MQLNRFLLLSILAAFGVGQPELVQGQIVPATDVGATGTTVSLPVAQQGPNSQIDIGGGITAQSNLFHSFEQFSTAQGQTANFLVNPAIQNILTRVNGGNASIINGLMQVTGGNANLYLMNPAGVLFGPNASLNIPGSFLATTANGMRFGANSWFSAVGANSYRALTGNPLELAFTMTNPGSIVNAGNLSVPSGQSISLAGGVVINTGTITTPGGKISIQAVPGQGRVELREEGKVLGFSFNTSGNDILPVNPLTFTPTALPQLLTGGKATEGARGVTLAADGTIRLTGSEYGFTNQPGTAIISNSISADGAKVGAVEVNGKVVELAGANVNGTDITLGGTESVKVQSSTFSKPNTLSSSKGTINIFPRDNRFSSDELGIANFDVAQPLNTGGRNLNIRAKKVTVGDILSEGGNIDFWGSLVLEKDAIFNAGNGSISLGRIDSDPIKAPSSLSILAPTKAVSLGDIGTDRPLQSLTVNAGLIGLNDLNGLDYRKINTLGNIKINSNQSISILGTSITTSGGGDINIETPQSIYILGANFKGEDILKGKEIRLVAGDSVDIRDGVVSTLYPEQGAVKFQSSGNLSIQGNKSIRILATANSASNFTSDADTLLTSNGVIIPNAQFATGGKFITQTLSGKPGDISSGTSKNTLISSVGDVEFGNYVGLALKVESKGSIKAGNIRVLAANPDLKGSDSDISFLKSTPSLVLRAGVTKLQNPVNVPTNKVGGSDFKEDSNSMSPATITVGNIDTSANGQGGEIRLFAPGNILAGNIFTRPIDPFSSNVKPIGGSVEVHSELGNASVGDIRTSGGNISIVGQSLNVKNIIAGASPFIYRTGREPDVYLNLGKVTLRSTSGNIEVQSIYSGSGSLDIDAAQLFRVTGVSVFPSSVITTLSSTGAQYLRGIEKEIKLKDSPELIDFFVKAGGFERKILESSEATIIITRGGASDTVRKSFPVSIGIEGPGSITIRHGGLTTANLTSKNIQIVGKKEGQSGFIIGPARVAKEGPEFFQIKDTQAIFDPTTFDPTDPKGHLD